eukprot:scaffold942_cov260-Pinguiococcus_pyrenoidosus.AAC.13
MPAWRRRGFYRRDHPGSGKSGTVRPGRRRRHQLQDGSRHPRFSVLQMSKRSRPRDRQKDRKGGSEGRVGVVPRSSRLQRPALPPGATARAGGGRRGGVSQHCKRLQTLQASSQSALSALPPNAMLFELSFAVS